MILELVPLAEGSLDGAGLGGGDIKRPTLTQAGPPFNHITAHRCILCIHMRGRSSSDTTALVGEQSTRCVLPASVYQLGRLLEACLYSLNPEYNTGSNGTMTEKEQMLTSW